MLRVGWVATALTGAFWFAAPGQSHAQDWPNRPVKIVVAFSPGGSADQFGRLMASELSAAFRQQFFVENRPGNSGAIGSAQVARAETDGYTLLIGGSGPHLTGPAINPNNGYDPLKDFTHIAMIGADSYAWAANPALGARSLAELVGLAKQRKDPITSPATGEHLGCSGLKRCAWFGVWRRCRRQRRGRLENAPLSASLICAFPLMTLLFFDRLKKGLDLVG